MYQPTITNLFISVKPVIKHFSFVPVQVYYHCNQRGHRDSFLCTNGTIFNQRTFVCEWWYNVNCAEAEANYFRNDLLHVPPKESSESYEDDRRRDEEDYAESDRPSKPSRRSQRPRQDDRYTY